MLSTVPAPCNLRKEPLNFSGFVWRRSLSNLLFMCFGVCTRTGKIDCGGNDTYRNMTVHFYGFAYHVYSVEDSTCRALEGEGHHHFQLNDVVHHASCKYVVRVSGWTAVPTNTVTMVIQIEKSSDVSPGRHRFCSRCWSGKMPLEGNCLSLHKYSIDGRRVKMAQGHFDLMESAPCQFMLPHQ